MSVYCVPQHRATAREVQRTEDLLRLVPKGRKTVLDIGALDGFFSEHLAQYFETVTALDLKKPAFTIDRVITVEGNVKDLQFPDNSFDVVFCVEVLEHVPGVEVACREICRVARHEVVIGVPLEQDTRVGKTTCQKCGQASPPWGHVNKFTEERLESLFSPLRPISTSFIGTSKERTNPVSTLLMDMAGNPWGVYGATHFCVHCGGGLLAPRDRSFPEKVMSGVALYLNKFQAGLIKERPIWMHKVFQKAP